MTALLRGTVIVSLLTQLSRFLGLIREILTARVLGAGFYADAFFVAFRIPNLLRSFFAEGALTSAFVPLFSSALEKDKEQAQKALATVAGFLVLTTSALTLLGIVYAPLIVEFFAPGFSDEKIAYCSSLTRIMLPYITIISLVAMLNGALNSVHVFGTSAMAQVAMNGVLIIGALCALGAPQSSAALILSWSVIGGGIIGLITQLPALTRAGFSLRFFSRGGSTIVRELLTLMLPALLGGALYQLQIFVSTLLATLIGEGAVSSLYYADRLAQLPIGVFTVALGSVLLPTLSRTRAQGDTLSFNKALSDSLRYTSFALLPIAGYLYCFSSSLISLVYEGGEFKAEDVAATASCLTAFSIGLWGTSCYSIAIKAALARKDTVTPTLIGALSLVIGSLLGVLLMGAPSSSEDSSLRSLIVTLQNVLPTYPLGASGLALASGIASFCSFLLIALFISVRMKEFVWDPFIDATIKSVVALLCTVAVLHYIPVAFLSLGRYGELFINSILFCVLFFVASRCLASKEAKEIETKIIHRLRS